MQDIDTPYLTVAEVAAVLRCEPDYVRKLCSTKQLRGTKLGGRQGWRIHRDDLAKFMGATKPAAPTRDRRRAR